MVAEKPVNQPDPEASAKAKGEWFAHARRLRQWFALRQRRTRRWIGVDMIVDYYARDKAGAGPEVEERLRHEAYSRLIDAMRAGVFELNGRSRVMRFGSIVCAEDLLDGRRPRVLSWLTATQLEDYLEVYRSDLNIVCQHVLASCWLPSDRVKQWLQDHGLTAPSYWYPSSMVSAEPGRPNSPRRKRSVPETPREKLKRALRDLHREGVDILSPPSVDVLHTMAVKKADSHPLTGAIPPGIIDEPIALAPEVAIDIV
jgi:hypothetical protein